MATAKAPAKRKAARKAPTPRKKAAPQVTKPQTVEVTTGPQSDNDPVWRAKLEAYSALQSVGAAIPDELEAEVGTWLVAERARLTAVEEARAQESADRIAKDAAGPKWVRNLQRGPFSIRLDRQAEERRKIELRPRGQRGDMCPLKEGDENDPGLSGSLGFIEVIGNTEAQEVLGKQSEHIQKHDTVLAMIRNEKGEPVQRLVVEQEFNKQGVTVAYVDQNAKAKAPLGGLVRPQDVERIEQHVVTGGNPAIVSSGFQPMSADARAQAADELARVKGQQGRPEDVLGLVVSVDPTQKT